MPRHRPAPPPGAPLEEVDAWLAESGIDVEQWPPPSPEQIERLRALFGYANPPALSLSDDEARRAS